MRIAGSLFAFQVDHSRSQQTTVHESLRVWSAPVSSPATSSTARATESATTGDLKLTLLRLLIERLTGRKLELVELAEVLRDPPVEGTLPPSWGASYDRETTYREAESTRVTATGLVQTADGRTIQVELALQMSRSFMQREGIHLRAGAALKDPLVINFAGNAAQLSATSFAFDLDSNGTNELLPQLQSGSAYLALDRNGNGAIDQGSELFGPTTGSGFAELARYDADGNGWIDEADPVFAQLSLWSGSDSRLAALEEQEIGAIHLGAIASPFQLKQGDLLLGQVTATGLYLREDGAAGTVQQIDLKV